MRDPNRIDKFCDELKTIWHKAPDMRFTQLVESTICAWNVDPINKCSSFYVEDEEFFKFMNEYWQGIKNEG